jgi:dTDP-4-amino-4,6-dideoxygalactose transaminase
MMKVPFLDLQAQAQALKGEILQSWEEIFLRAAYVGGEQVSQFEHEFAAACQCKECIAVSNGTDALVFILKAIGICGGDEVIVPVNTFIATAEAVTIAGGKVVFVDVQPGTLLIDPARVAAAITPRTKAIIPVHLYGQPAQMDPILHIAQEHGLYVVEDSAQAHLAEYKGRRTGSMGIAAGFSFYPGKNLGACGEAGAVTTNDSGIAEHIRKLRDHGSNRKYYHDFEGHNGRCDTLQAAALLAKLRHLREWNERRREHAQYYIRRLLGSEVALPVVAPDVLPVRHLFVVQVERRDEVRQYLQDCGIGTGLHYPVPLHMQRAYSYLRLREGLFPVAERASKRLLSLPMFPELTEAQIEYVCDCLLSVTAPVEATSEMEVFTAAD